MAAVGIYSYQKLPIDAVPDITNVQVQINTAAPAIRRWRPSSASPSHRNRHGRPAGLKQTRSLSRSGLSQVTVIFKDGTDIFFARQLVNERLQVAREQLPEGIEAGMGPISTGLGEIFLWTVEAEEGAQGGRHALHADRPARDPGLDHQAAAAQRAGRGRDQHHRRLAKQYLIAPEPKRLAAYKLTLNDLVAALERNNANVGAGYIERNGEQLLIRAPGQVASAEDIANIVISSVDGTPIRISDVAEVASAASCARARPPKTAAKWCWARCSC
jgi:cobalt-zinc-cadmium resistance protein CzcA